MPSRRRRAVSAVGLHVVLLGLAYVAYSEVADRAPRAAGAALARTRMLQSWEHRLHIGVELPVNRWWAASHLREYVGNYYYDGMHFLVPLTVLVWLFVAHRSRYPVALAGLVAASLLGLAGFYLFPTAPPRLLPHAGFIDTVARVHTFGGGGAHGMTAQENPFAAMPSLHVAWAAWSTRWVVTLARRLLVRVLLVLHVALTVFVIVATGNHLLLDAVAGVAVVAVAEMAVAAVTRGRRPDPIMQGFRRAAVGSIGSRRIERRTPR